MRAHRPALDAPSIEHDTRAIVVYRLTLELGERSEQHALAGGEHLVGSHPTCGIVVAHPTVSRRHARVIVSPAGVEIEDLGSRNGTWLDGRRVAGTATVQVGVRLLLGSVPAVFDEVAEDDLEIAVPLATEPGPATHESLSSVAPGETTTASLGSLRTLTLQELPRLLDLLAAGASAQRMVQAVGVALFEGLPCCDLEVRRAGSSATAEPGVLFAASRSTPDRSELAMARVESGDHVVEATFPHELQATSMRPVIASLLRLIALADGEPAPTCLPPPTSPPLPEPATVVPAMRRIYERARLVARGDVPVLILGESGTGKEVLARFLHAASQRARAPFVALNCAALPRDLLEAELFGIEERVATGVAARPGRFESAHGGTLFLDEIGDMAAETQARILRVLQEGEVYRVGGTRPRPAAVRTIAATNRDLAAMLDAGTFRADLYHRIADWCVTLPPLRDRRDDIPNLAAWFLAEEAARRGVRLAGISRGALQRLQAYSWPGNIRQLQREMARAALFLEAGQALESGHLDDAIRRAAPPAAGHGTLRERLDAAERDAIHQALSSCHHDVGAAARALGIGRSTLYRRMAELGIERPE